MIILGDFVGRTEKEIREWILDYVSNISKKELDNFRIVSASNWTDEDKEYLALLVEDSRGKLHQMTSKCFHNDLESEKMFKWNLIGLE